MSENEGGEIYLDLRDVSSADLARHVTECLQIMGKGLPASKFRFFATALALLRGELRRRGDSEDPGAIVGMGGVPEDVMAIAEEVQGL